jgi:large subunit ribosomal protein L6
MSRIGKKPVAIPSGVKVNMGIDRTLNVSGPKGSLSQWIDPEVNVNVDPMVVSFSINNTIKRNKALFGLYRNLTQNMVLGVTEGYTKKLELIGVGFDCELRGKGLYFELGLAHGVYFIPPDGITFSVEKPKTKVVAKGSVNQYILANIEVKGIDKVLVGEVAAKIRDLKKPEVYKSKGIRYFGERVQLKAGKTGTK